MAAAGAGELADAGRREQQDLGRRVARRYRRLFNANATVTFFSSSSSRAADSLRSFRRALAAEIDPDIRLSSGEQVVC